MDSMRIRNKIIELNLDISLEVWLEAMSLKRIGRKKLKLKKGLVFVRG